MAHGDSPEGKWRGNWRMQWVASTLHTTSEHGVPSITTADAHTSAASSRLNWRPRRFKRTRPFRRKTKSGFCACAITFQTQSTVRSQWPRRLRHGSAAARLLGLRVRIPQEKLLPISCEFFVLSGKGLYVGPIPCPEESFRVCLIECDRVQQEPSASTVSR
jgi:hypothetical protein